MQMILPLSNAERVKRFGRFAFEPAPNGNPGAVRILGDWPSKNIVRVPCAQLARVRPEPAALIHRAAADAFVKVWRKWEQEALIDHVKSWNGSYVTRFKRGRSGGMAALSNHCWGTAFDINARLYPLGMQVPKNDAMRDLAVIANECGWFWGGDFRQRPDGMHFEYVGN